jgi:predicted DNA binding protein
MSVIAKFRIPSADFELGRILAVGGMSAIELESLVPIGEATVPLFWIHNATRDSFVAHVQDHPSVRDSSAVDVFEDRTLFRLDWDANRDSLFTAILEHDGQLLNATGAAEAWEFELRFPERECLGEFTADCVDAGISIDVTRVYNPTDPNLTPWYGLSEPQREAILLAVELGYYEIPRGCTTKELADELGISDQAVTERLRRAITTLVRSTLFVADDER